MPTDDYAIVVKSGSATGRDRPGRQPARRRTSAARSPRATARRAATSSRISASRPCRRRSITTFQMTAADRHGDRRRPEHQHVPAAVHRPGLSRLPGHGGQPPGLRPVQRPAPRAERRLQPRRRRRRPRLAPAAAITTSSTTTDASGKFAISSPRRCPKASSGPRSWWSARPTSRLCPASSSSLQHAFRIDKTAPQITGVAIVTGDPLRSPARPRTSRTSRR